jgi:2-methylcitrate dehydratase
VLLDALSQAAKSRTKVHLLDSFGCALGALQAAPIQAIRNEQERAQGSGRCFLIGGRAATPERAAFYNWALVRYLDFMHAFVTLQDLVSALQFGDWRLCDFRSPEHPFRL